MGYVAKNVSADAVTKAIMEATMIIVTNGRLGYTNSGAAHDVFKKEVDMTNMDKLLGCFTYVGSDDATIKLYHGATTLVDWGSRSTGAVLPFDVVITAETTGALRLEVDCDTAVTNYVENLFMCMCEA